jgi:uncharacterized membrane protein YebE (DUF533 family)
MGMLDRLLGDLVAGSTNLPRHVTRGLVRRAGGSKLLLAGGAAIAGALITQHLHSRQAQAAAQPAAPPPPPPSAAELGWSPPPLPPELAAPPGGEGGEGERDSGELELPPGLLFPVVRTMVAAALADGELEAAEREAIFVHLESGELAPSEVGQVRRDLVLPATPGELAGMLGDPGYAEVLYRFAYLTLRADGGLEPHEAAWLEQLGEALHIDATDRARLQAELAFETP